ncbi:MAG: YbaB/EbfC family nucleoid-associated protein [Oscillospiraceae bacterium]|nr:YbaB/EbfC family nucleoid-associated protein [Oscillospiraceae bacterium]MCD8323253.1 YbaB/EbfC family nucleoid-associated protein [Oscillospiraceae bacterium]
MAKNSYRGGGYGGMNQAAMMKQAQKMQQDLIKMQAELEEQTYTAASGGGVVKATVSGKRELTEVIIDPEAVDPEDVEMLQDLIVAAVNEALRKAEEASNQSMSRITGNLGGLGGMF